MSLGIDANKAAEYVRYNNYRFGTVSGNSSADILPSYYDDTPVTVDLKNQDIHTFDPTPTYSWDMTSDPVWTTEGSWAYGTPHERCDKARIAWGLKPLTPSWNNPDNSLKAA